MSGEPAKEKKFQELKTKYGSSWGFHGSAACNWHSIMRIGLKNMSGTSGQLNGMLKWYFFHPAGACYGNGIYLADDANTSFSYINKAGQIACLEIFNLAVLLFVKLF
jgi:hypothetical protein